MAEIVETRGSSPKRRDGWALWRRWMVATTLGEFAGFAIPAAIGPIAVRVLDGLGRTAAPLAMLGLMALAGMVEGASLAFGQSLVLRRAIPGVNRRAWVLATAVAAGVAYVLGMTPNTIYDIFAPDTWVMIVLAVLFGALILVSIGFAQYLVLRRAVRGAGRWVWVNAAAWLAGLPVPFVAMSLVPDASPVAVWIAAGVASGLLMGAVVAAVTGIGLVQLLREQV